MSLTSAKKGFKKCVTLPFCIWYKMYSSGPLCITQFTYKRPFLSFALMSAPILIMLRFSKVQKDKSAIFRRT